MSRSDVLSFYVFVLLTGITGGLLLNAWWGA